MQNYFIYNVKSVRFFIAIRHKIISRIDYFKIHILYCRY